MDDRAEHTPIVARLRSPAQAFYEYAADGGAQLREAADTIADLLEELEQQADGTSTIISLLAGQEGPVAASLRGMLSIQEQSARAAIAKARGAV